MARKKPAAGRTVTTPGGRLVVLKPAPPRVSRKPTPRMSVTHSPDPPARKQRRKKLRKGRAPPPSEDEGDTEVEDAMLEVVDSTASVEAQPVVPADPPVPTDPPTGPPNHVAEVAGVGVDGDE